MSKTLEKTTNATRSIDAADAATAPAYFLQSWAYFLQGKNAEALSAMEQVSTLAPDDKLYQDSLLLLKK